jgi:hypothetical protein
MILLELCSIVTVAINMYIPLAFNIPIKSIVIR